MNFTHKNSSVAMVGFLVLFYLAWTVKELWLLEYIYSFGEIRSALFEALVKSLIWIVPTVIYIKYFLHSNPISYLKLNTHVKKGLFWGFALSAARIVSDFTNIHNEWPIFSFYSIF